MTDTEAPLDKADKFQQNSIALEEVQEIDNEEFKNVTDGLFPQDEQEDPGSPKHASQENVRRKNSEDKETKICQVSKIDNGEIGAETNLQDILESIFTKDTAENEGQISCSNDDEGTSKKEMLSNEDTDRDLQSEVSNENKELLDPRNPNTWPASKSENDSGGNESQDSDNPIFPLSANQSSSFNYLQDLKKRKIKMKKPSTNILMTNKLLKLIRQQSKYRSSAQFPLYNSNTRRQEELKFEYDPEGMDISGSRYSHDVGDVFATNEDGQNTSGLYDSTGLYQCHLCPVAFASPISLRGHMSSHKIQKKFMCPICSRSFAHSSTLNYHIRKHKGDLRYKCDICGKRFLKPFRLKAHISCVHSGEKPYVCTICKKAFSCSINLTRHTRIHTGERPFLCLLCGKRFRDNSSFALHRRYHSQNRPYECDVCGKAFIKMHFLKTHKKCVHADDKNHECFICNKSFKVKDYLRKHLITHQENKRYKCDFCEKSFPRIGSLKKHRYLHTGEEPFKCEVCFKGFRDAYTLAKHARLHERKIEDRLVTGDEGEDRKKTLFQCDKCERKYSLSGSLKIHKQKYCKGKKPDEGSSSDFYCTGCGMLFHHKQSLAKHMKMTCESVYGKKDKVFLCSTCGLVFFSRVTLNDHLRTTTCSGKDIPEYYKCNICDATFSHRATLSKHKQLHGEDDLPEEEDTKPETEKTKPTRHVPLKDETGHRLFECKFCGETFRSKSALYDTHMRRCHGRPAQEKKNACEQCGRKFHSKSDLRAHIRIHTGEKPFTCGVCGKSFTQRGHVSMHMKIHTGQRDFPCTICGKAFQFATTLRNHVKIHTGERPHVCTLCGKGFIKFNNLKNHLAKHADIGETSGTVIKEEEEEEEDQEDMSQVMTLNEDNSTVTVSPVKKTASGKLLAQARQGTRKSSRAFRGASMKKLIEEEMNTISELEDIKVEPVDYDDINSFEQSVSEEKSGDEIEAKVEEDTSVDLKCPFCKEDQPSAHELAKHIKSHTGSTPFLCKYCGKSFLQESHLQSHMLIHDKKVQEYRCLVCMGSFPTSKILQCHMRTHKGERPYGCYLCDKAYTTSQHLRRHVKSNHPEKLEVDMNMMPIPSSTLNKPKEEDEVKVKSPVKKDFLCQYCEKQYSKNQHLMRHVRTHHPEMLGEVTSSKKSNTKQTVKIKTEIVWEPESTSAEDTGNPEDKYSTPDSLKSSESSDDDTIIQEPASPRPDSPSQERIYVPKRMIQGAGSPGRSASTSESESYNRETGRVGEGRPSVTGGESQPDSGGKASASESNASASEGNVSASKSNASASEGNASDSEDNSSASEGNGSASEGNASDSGSKASASYEKISSKRKKPSTFIGKSSASRKRSSVSRRAQSASSAGTEDEEGGFVINIKKEPSDSEYEEKLTEEFLLKVCVVKKITSVKVYPSGKQENTYTLMEDEPVLVRIGEKKTTNKDNLSYKFIPDTNFSRTISLSEGISLCLSVAERNRNINEEIQRQDSLSIYANVLINLGIPPDSFDRAESSQCLSSIGDQVIRYSTSNRTSDTVTLTNSNNLSAGLRSYSSSKLMVVDETSNESSNYDSIASAGQSELYNSVPPKSGCDEINQNIFLSSEVLVETETVKAHGHKKNVSSTCDVCGKSFFTEKQLSVHKKVHIGQREDGKYYCKLCKKTYRKRVGYLKHKREAKCDMTSMLTCSKCDKAFSDQTKLNMHRRYYHGEGESYRCERCKTWFSKLKSYTRHRARGCVDPSETTTAFPYKRPCKCETCGKILSSKESLERHMRHHTGDKPHVCSTCGKGFVDIYTMQTHEVRMHTDFRPHLCQECGKTFNNVSHLNKHIATHSDKTFQCSFCSRQYKYIESLQNHQKRAHASVVEAVDLQTEGILPPNPT